MVFFHPVKVGAIKEEKVVQLQKRLCCPGSAQNEPPTNWEQRAKAYLHFPVFAAVPCG